MTRQFSDRCRRFFQLQKLKNEWVIVRLLDSLLYFKIHKRNFTTSLCTATIQEWIELCAPLRVLPFIVFLRLREILRGQMSTRQGCQSSEGVPSSWDEVLPGSVDLLFGSHDQERCYAPLDFVLLLYPKHGLNQPGSQGDNIRGSNEYNRTKSVIDLADQIKNVEWGMR